MNIAIIGGGLTGLSCAYYLTKKGHDITIFEKKPRFGGLADSFNINGEPIEIYYHHFFKGDKNLMALLKELKLDKEVSYFESTMGFLKNNKIYSFSTPLDLIFFKPLNFFDRVRLGFMILYLQTKKDWKSLENISIKDWITKYFGKNIYETIWKPLLINKFGDEHENIPASWLWGRIHPRSNSRKNGKELLGYLNGSFSVLINKLHEKIKNSAKIIFQEVIKIDKIKENLIIKTSDKKSYKFEKIVYTGPNPELLKIINLPDYFINNLKKIKYQAVVCTCLELKNKLSSTYWMNISDKNLPFGGIIEHTNLVPSERYKSKIVYLFNYLSENNKFFHMTNEDLTNIYIKSLKKIFPKFKESDLIRSTTFRDKYATPVYNLGYSKKIPAQITPIDGLLIANTSQIYPYDRNIDNSIKLGKQTAELIG